MYHFVEAIQNTKGDALIGYYVKALSVSSGTVADIYADDSSTPIVSVSGVANAAKVDSDGNASFFIPSGEYHLDVYATDASTFVKRFVSIPMIDVDAVAGVAADRVVLSAIAAEADMVRNLTESGREGLFRFDDSDLSAEVAADTAQGIYVAPDTDDTGASGAWVRQVAGPWVFDWFGAVPGDYATGESADCLEAWEAMQSLLDVLDRNVSAAYIANAPKLFFPGAQYCFSDKLVVNRAMHLIGQGGNALDEATWLRWTEETGGIVINRGGSTFTGEESLVTGGGGSLIEGFVFQGAGGTPVGTATTDLLYSAIRVKDRCEIKNCMARNWRGAGLCISASIGAAVSDAFYGNINGVVVTNVRIEDCSFNGVYCSGGDANVIKLDCVDVANCGRFGFWISPFLGTTLVNCQVAHCGVPSHSGLSEYSLVHYSGNWYYAKYDASTATLQGETPGTGSNWLLYGAGSATADVPTWTGLHTYVPGGSYGGTGAFTTLVGCYHETGQGFPQLPSALVLGGFMGAGVSNQNEFYTGSGGTFTNSPITQKKTYSDASTTSARIGGTLGNTWTDVLGYQSSVAGAAFDGTRVTAFAQNKTTGNLAWRTFANQQQYEAGQVPVFLLNGVNTDRRYGRSAQADAWYVVEIDQLALGTGDNARVIQGGTAAPGSGSHAQGEILLNRSIALTSPARYLCSATGTPGTWIADYPNVRADASTGIGYVTGAGGAVTQATSRTTGVTLNKVCGSITLVSAAGSTSWQTFTVTNSTVAATDVIRVVQKSGTDKNMIHVTAVAAGSFDITFATTGGTTTEQPVFNFAVVKAVAA